MPVQVIPPKVKSQKSQKFNSSALYVYTTHHEIETMAGILSTWAGPKDQPEAGPSVPSERKKIPKVAVYVSGAAVSPLPFHSVPSFTMDDTSFTRMQETNDDPSLPSLPVLHS